MTRTTKYITLTLALLTLCAIAASAQTKPRLMVNIVVSSMRADDMERYAENFTNNGFRRLATGGHNFTSASIDYMQTTTPASLSTIATGAMPSTHGVVADRWYDHVSNKLVVLIDDQKEQSVNYSGGSGSYSPRNLVAETLSDALARQSAESHIATIATEPLSAIVVINGCQSDLKSALCVLGAVCGIKCYLLVGKLYRGLVALFCGGVGGAVFCALRSRTACKAYKH